MESSSSPPLLQAQQQLAPCAGLPADVPAHSAPLLDMNREPDSVDRDFKFPFRESAPKLASDVNLNDLPDDSNSTVRKATGVDISVPCFVTHDLNISPVETEDFAGIPTGKTDLTIASTDLDAGSSEHNVTEFSNSEVPSEKSTLDVPFHDMVVLKDGPVTVAVPLAECKTPLVGDAGNTPPSQLSGGMYVQ